MIEQIHPFEKKNSGLGIASFIISMLMLFSVCVTVAFTAFAQQGVFGKGRDIELIYLAVGLFMFAIIAVCLISLGLGIGNLFEKQRKKIFGILGIFFSLIVMLGLAALFIIGSMLP